MQKQPLPQERRRCFSYGVLPKSKSENLKISLEGCIHLNHSIKYGALSVPLCVTWYMSPARVVELSAVVGAESGQVGLAVAGGLFFR